MKCSSIRNISEILTCKVTFTVTNLISVIKWNVRLYHVEQSVVVYFEIIGLHLCFLIIEACILKRTVTVGDRPELEKLGS
jgi:hypothetical protein